VLFLFAGFLLSLLLPSMDSAQNTKGASPEAAPLVPFENLVYISILSIWRG